MRDFLSDLRYAARGLRRSPTYTLAAVATLALALGANAAIFDLSWSVLLRSLPYGEPERIVAIENPPLALRAGGFEPSRVLRESPVLESVSLYYEASGANLESADAPRRIRVSQVSGTFLQTLGSQPLIGRDFAPEEAVAEANRVLLMSEGLWRAQYNGDPGVLGQTVRLNGIVYTVIGVMPARFELPVGADAWIPLPMVGEFATGNASSPLAIGRLRAGVHIDAAQASIRAADEARRPYEPGEPGVRLVGIQEQLSGSLRTPLRLLAAAAGVVLLIGCINLSGLMIVRASSREREFALRAAIGAGATRLARLQLAEGLVIATLGAIAALLVVAWTIDGIVALFPVGMLPTQRVTPDAAVLTFTAAAAALAALAFALPPALRAARSGRRFQQASAAGEAPDRLRVRNGLLVGQVALAFVLVVAAALLGRTLANLYDLPLGFRTEDVVTQRVVLPLASYGTDAQRVAFADRMLERVAVLPTVMSAGVGDDLPLSGEMGVRFRISSPSESFEQASADGDDRRIASHSAVTAGWFRTMGATVLSGRTFEEGDGRGEPVFVINDVLADALFPDRVATGQRIRLWKGPTPVDGTVIGVIQGIRDRSVREAPGSQLWEPFAQATSNLITLAVRHRGERAAVIAGVRAIVHEIDAALPVHDVRDMDDVVAASVGPQRGVTMLMSAFGTLALLLAAVGLYGLIAQSVVQRRREIGVRMALGARRHRVLGLILSRGLRLAAIGTLLGIAGAAVSARALRSLLFGIQPLDAATFGIATLVVVGAAAFACLAPALRATRVDPLDALRD